MKVEDYIREGKFSVKKETYSIMKTKRSLSNVFASVCDGEEITIVMEHYKAVHSLPKEDIVAIDSGWKVITFQVDLPSELVGFIATVSRALAERDISIFSISAFSSDHVLVKEDDLESAIEALKEIGFSQVEDPGSCK